MSKNTSPYKKGETVEVKGDQIGGGNTWALYWFRGTIVQITKRKGRQTYNVKMQDPTRFNQKRLIVKNLEPRYLRRMIATKISPIAKGKKRSPRGTGGAAFVEAGAEGSVCESWADTLAREAAEREALRGTIKKKKRKKKSPKSADGKSFKIEGKYKRGVNIRRKVEEVKTDEFHLMNRDKLLFGDVLFQTGDKIRYREQVYDLKRLRIYKERPVLILENKDDGVRRAEVKDCKIEKSVDALAAEVDEAEKKKSEVDGTEDDDKKEEGGKEKNKTDENVEDDNVEEGNLTRQNSLEVLEKALNNEREDEKTADDIPAGSNVKPKIDALPTLEILSLDSLPDEPPDEVVRLDSIEHLEEDGLDLGKHRKLGSVDSALPQKDFEEKLAEDHKERISVIQLSSV